MKIVATYIVRELKSPYTLRKVHETEEGKYFMELGMGMWELTKGEFLELVKEIKKH
ncbi:MAG TPA: hypothetical protein VK172_10190 [Lentimicrobium sp.]|nr:hypothetical protein [Lentimicrobium sp.]